MEKWMCLGAIGVAGLVLILSLMDLFVGYPFSSGNGFNEDFMLFNIGAILASGIVAYLGWNAFKDVK